MDLQFDYKGDPVGGIVTNCIFFFFFNEIFIVLFYL